MANERAWMVRNTGTEAAPVWEKYFPRSVVDAIMASDAEGETRTVMDLVREEIQKVVGSAPEAFDTLQEIAEYIEAHEEVAAALQAAVGNKADKDHTHAAATTTAAGFMSAADKAKLDRVATGANNYTHPTGSGSNHIPAGGVEGQILGWKADGEAQWQDKENVQIDNATTTTPGLMSAADKAKLDGIANEATKNAVDAALSETSTNPVQNKIVNAALEGKVPTSRKVNGKELTGDVTLGADDVSAIPADQKGTAGGVAELDTAGKVPAAQLPSYVDDVIEGYLSEGAFYEDAAYTTEITGESGKIYVDLDDGKTYRWSGTAFVEISASLALGETSTTAYRGDRGKIAYDHSQAAHAPVDAEANVQSDWNETDAASDAYIKNKPDIPTITFGPEFPTSAPYNSIHFLTE